MKYKYILFDADETLFTFDNFNGLKETVEQHGQSFSKEDFDVYLKYNKQLWAQYQNNEISAEFLQVERFRDLAKRLGTSAQALNDQFLDNMAKISVPLPGVYDLLAKMKTDFTLGIITNGLSRMQKIRIENNNMLGWFDCLIVSEETGEPKPNISIFEHAFKTLGQPNKNEVLMVGDTIATDILGGNKAGIDTVWLQHPNIENTSDIEPTYTIKTFSELESIVYGD